MNAYYYVATSILAISDEAEMCVSRMQIAHLSDCKLSCMNRAKNAGVVENFPE